MMNYDTYAENLVEMYIRQQEEQKHIHFNPKNHRK